MFRRWDRDKEEYTQELRDKLSSYLKNLGHIRTQRVEEAFRAIPRHVFVPDEDLQRVYSDVHILTKLQDGVPISSSSQPAIMAIMLEQLDLQPGHHVLEIGAGTGYNAALMAHCVGTSGSVTTIDIDQDIVEAARVRLEIAGVTNVKVICADGIAGNAAEAPFDRIILTVGAADIATAWREQLRPGGRLVLPFKLTPIAQSILMSNWQAADQMVLALEHMGDHLESRSMSMCGFMPLRGQLALQTLPLVQLSSMPGLSMVAIRTIDAGVANSVLNGFYQSDPLPLSILHHELWSLRLWLALRDGTYCELYQSGDVQEHRGPIAPDEALDAVLAAPGLYAHGTFCLLMRSTSDTHAVLDADKLLLRTFGTDRTLTECLMEQIAAWDRAGRPFRWSSNGTMEGVSIHVYPKDALYVVADNEFLVERTETRLVFRS